MHITDITITIVDSYLDTKICQSMLFKQHFVKNTGL